MIGKGHGMKAGRLLAKFRDRIRKGDSGFMISKSDIVDYDQW